MNIFKLSFSILLSILLISCGDAKEKKVYSEKGKELYTWEQNKKDIASINDMVLIYGGGSHRSYEWTKDLFKPYVTYVDESNKEHWMFDGFLFLEIVNGKQKIFATGYYGTPATKVEWKALVDYYFTEDKAVYALDQCIGEAVARLGNPDKKHKIVIGMPEPIDKLSTWGEVNGDSLDFTISDAERLKACEWYVDYVRESFDKGNFQNIELGGFYWIAETATHTRTILGKIAESLNDMNYSFNWIPYWNSDGYKNWKDLKYNYAYLQPNYFFNDKVEYSRLDQACQAAIDYDMDMEVEFDDGVVVEKGYKRAYRLRDYMKAFREHGIIENKRLAYYQGGNAVFSLYNSKDTEDNKLYHEFCKFVLDHQKNMKK